MDQFISNMLGPLFMFALLYLGIRTWVSIKGKIAEGEECKKCGYSRIGLPKEASCPECGSEQKYPGSGLHISNRKTVRSTKHIAINLLMIAMVLGIAYGSIKLDDYRHGYYGDFVQSIRKGDLQAVEHYLDRYPELAEGRFRYVSQFDDSGGPISYAIYSSSPNKADLITLLLQHGADPNTYYHRRPALAIALLSDQKHEVIRVLLDAGADPDDLIDGFNQSAIAFAAWQGDRETVQLLVDAGADLNHIDDEGMTALDHVHHFLEPAHGANTPYLKIAELLRSNGAKHADELNKESSTTP